MSYATHVFVRAVKIVRMLADKTFNGTALLDGRKESIKLIASNAVGLAELLDLPKGAWARRKTKFRGTGRLKLNEFWSRRM